MGGESPILDVISPLTRVGRIMLENLSIILFPDSHNFSRATVYYSRIIAELEFTIGKK